MTVDGREISLTELFLRLKELFDAQCGMDVDVDVFVGNFRDSKKVSAFAAMSGCRTDLAKREGFYIVRITGSVCCG
jgi:hypothetical protein